MSNSVYPSAIHGLTFTVLKEIEEFTFVQPSANRYEVRVIQTSNPIWHWRLIYEYLYDNFISPNNTKPFSPYTDLATLMGFFMARNGQFDDFLFTDPDDNTVTAQTMQIVNDGLGTYYTPIQRWMGGQFYEDVTDLNPLSGSGLVVKANGVTQTGGGTNYTFLGPGLAIPGFSFMGMYIKWTNPTTNGVWQSGHAYLLNNTILDPAGHIQKVTTAGTSGASQPAWNDTGGTTPDGTGSLVWTDQGYNPGPAGPITASFSFYFRVRFETDSQDFEKFMDNLWTIGGQSTKNGKGMLELMSSRVPTV
jgi:hypothetical protein